MMRHHRLDQPLTLLQPQQASTQYSLNFMLKFLQVFVI
tara:strand:+ start:11480 stop:11593 length:114 start_codon:yes stop_codon:yes gene_type:complete